MAAASVVIEEADKLYTSYAIQELYDYLTSHKDTGNAEILWRLARATRDLSNDISKSAEEKKQLSFEALEYAKEALSADDGNNGSHKWYAICTSRVGNYVGSKKKIEDSPSVKEHLEKAIELDPNDATSEHHLGLWYRMFVDLEWYEAKVAAVVFGTPPSATYQEALDHFLKAEEISPNFYTRNLYMIGTTYLKMGNTEQAKLYMEKTKKAPARREDENEAVKQATDHLKSL